MKNDCLTWKDGSEYIWSGEQKYLTVQLLHLSFFPQLMKLSCFDKEGKSAFILFEAFIRQERSFATVIRQIYPETSLDWEQKHQGTFSKTYKFFFYPHLVSFLRCYKIKKSAYCRTGRPTHYLILPYAQWAREIAQVLYVSHSHPNQKQIWGNITLNMALVPFNEDKQLQTIWKRLHGLRIAL